jgi:hypothetical protein
MSMLSTRRALMLGAFLTAFAATAPWAQAEGEAEVQTIRAVSHSIPAGGRAQAVAAADAAGPRIIPAGEAELARIKALAGGSEGGASLVAAGEAAELTVGVRNQNRRRVCQTDASTGAAPSGINGAVGPQIMVVVTNSAISRYNKKSCARVGQQSLATFFAAVGVPATAQLRDPRVIYDRRSRRFFVTAVSTDSGNTDQYQYVAVSADATGRTFNLYRITLSEGTARFCKRNVASTWDFPMAGVSNARWFVTANDKGPAGGVRGAILSLDKRASLNGAPMTVKCFNQLPANLAATISLDTSAATAFLSPGSGSSSRIERRVVTAVGGGVANDTLTVIAPVIIPTWWAPPAAAQPNGQLLDTLDGRFVAPSIQNQQKIVNVHSVKVRDTAKIRLYHVSTLDEAVAPTLIFTPTTVEDESDNLFTASIATNYGAANAPVFISATRTIPGNRNAGRPSQLLFSGPADSADSARWRYALIGTSQAQMTGCASQPPGVCRWGDYSSTQIEPGNAQLGWGFNQLVAGTGAANQSRWTTRAGLMQAFRGL